MKTINIFPHSKWLVRVSGDYHKPLQDWMKQFPGCQWVPDKKYWAFPVDMLEELYAKARELHVGVDMFYKSPAFDVWRGSFMGGTHKPYPFQAEAGAFVASTLKMYGASHALWEMGLGKTVLTNLLMQVFAGPVLVLCPAMVTTTWEDETREWSPDRTPIRLSPTAQKRWQKAEGDVWILSHGLIERFYNDFSEPFMHPEFNLIIIDEIHSFASDKTIRTQALRRLLGRFPDAKLLGLTGTLDSDKVESMHNPLDILYPGRFGPLNQFKFRHMESKPNDYGHDFFGARADTAGELRDRLSRTGSRVTKRDVAHLLPDLIGPVIAYAEKPGRKGRIRAACDLALAAAAQGETHISIQCHRKETVDTVCARLAKGRPDFRIITLTGDFTPAQRDARRKDAKAADNCFLVSTIDATEVGIDLTFNGQVIYCELVDSLQAMLQSLGRYQRLVTGSTPTTVTWVLPDKNDKQALRLAKKVKAYNLVQKADFGGAKMEESLAEVEAKSGLDRAEILELLAMATASHNPEGAE